ncbi:hypothetical protein AT15_08770 [Kosmotoga arenicorallina S304]|uniref:DUF3352 domain-containing protein n=1 Tax=Kosmotoga arenicorallina S304 TaxID=1453497 RepID=A0A176K1N9_9BACT|nr:hypothetical protein [Kosmotoga arenicorallina]OAA31057.1 hypothetical protein AT15_08770 [Kosmotoga arenicorallina S304]
MKRGIMFFLFFLSAIVAFASIEELATKIPSSALNVLLVEDLKGNYENLKGTTLGDVLLNQLALDQIAAQYIEMAAYNNGQDPQVIYSIFSSNLAAANWSSESGSKSIVILGPIEKAENARKAIESVLPQFLPENFNLNIATDGKYLYIGDVDAYSRTEKGYQISIINELPEGFMYIVGGDEEFSQKVVLYFEDNYLKGDGILSAKTQQASEKLRALFEGASVEKLEAAPRFSFATISLKANSIEEAESLLMDRFNLSLTTDTVQALSKDFLDKISGKLTGELLVDVELDIDALLNSFMSMQMGDANTTEDTTSVPPLKLVSKMGFNGNFEELLSLMEEAGVPYTAEGNVAKTEQNMYIWIDGGYIVSSLANKDETDSWLQHMTPLKDNPVFTQFSRGVPAEHSFSLFIDAGIALSALMGTEVESGIAAFSWYSYDDNALKGKFIIK